MSENPTAAALPTGHKLEEYVVEELLGQGGFGITYLARDTRLGAKVAIKEYFPQSFAARKNTLIIRPVPPPGGPAEKNYQWGLQEFLKEAQALARFKHPNIVRVLRFLEANGTAYMVMEYEQGESLAAYLKRHGGFLEESALMKIFLPILSGLQAVHEAGLVHLDIKPDNIYLRENGEPMLIDFGSSRQSREDPAAGRVALTPGYSAPEQYPGQGQGKVGPSSDLYSIGATLYRCITGHEPVDAYKRQYQYEKAKVDPQPPACKFERPRYSQHIRETIDATLKLDAAERPRSASAVQFGLMGKGLNVETSKRTVYGSGFIGIVRTATEAVKKRTGVKRGFLEKLFVVVLFTVTMAISTATILVSTGQLSQDELFTLIERVSEGTVDLAYNTRDAINDKLFGIKTSRPARAAPAAPAQTKPKPVPEKTVPAFILERTLARTLTLPEPAHLLALSAEHGVLVTATVQGRIQLWETASGKPIASFTTYDDALPAMAVSPKGRWLAFADKEHQLVIYDLEQRKTVTRLAGHTAAVSALAFSPDGQQLVSSGEDLAILVWDVDGQKKLKTLGESKATILTFAYSPNGRLLAAGDRNGGIRSWDMQENGVQLAYFLTGSDSIQTLAYSPDSAWLAAGGQKQYLRLLDLSVDRRDRILKPAPKTTSTVIYTPDGRWLLVAGGEGEVLAWDTAGGGEPKKLVAHGSAVGTLAISGDGQWLVTAGEDKTVKLWQPSPEPQAPRKP